MVYGPMIQSGGGTLTTTHTIGTSDNYETIAQGTNKIITLTPPADGYIPSGFVYSTTYGVGGGSIGQLNGVIRYLSGAWGLMLRNLGATDVTLYVVVTVFWTKP